MRCLAELPFRIMLIPFFLMVLVMLAMVVPFVCLFGTITWEK